MKPIDSKSVLQENLRKANQEEAFTCFRRLIKKQPELKDDILSYFAVLDPKFFLNIEEKNISTFRSGNSNSK